MLTTLVFFSQRKMKTEEEFQDCFSTAVRELRNIDQTFYLTSGFDFLFQHYIPNIVKKYGSINTLYQQNRLKYMFSISDVETYNCVESWSDCFDFGLTKVANVTGILKLEVIPLLAPKNYVPTLISQVRAIIAQIPIPTGKTGLSGPASDEPFMSYNRHLPSGTFVCQGKMRSMPPVKAMLYNQKLLMRKKEYDCVQVRSTHFAKTPFRYTSTINFRIYRTAKRGKNHMEGFITCVLPFSKHDTHVSILAKAFGFPFDVFVDMVKRMAGGLYDANDFRAFEINMLYDKALRGIHTQIDALKYISRLREKDNNLSHSNGTSIAIKELKNELFPHLNVSFAELEEEEDKTFYSQWLQRYYKQQHHIDEEPENNKEINCLKTLYLASCVADVILLHTGKITETPRDWFTYASMTMPSHHIGTLFRTVFYKHIKSRGRWFRKSLVKIFKKGGGAGDAKNSSYIDLVKLFGEPILTVKVRSAMMTGRWSARKVGVTLAINSNNANGWMGQLLRISSAIKTTDAVHTDPRNVQFDGYGFICGASSPDGEIVGLVMESATIALITPDFVEGPLLSRILEAILEPFLIPLKKEKREEEKEYIYFNNCGIPTHVVKQRDLLLLVETFRLKRRQGRIPPFAFVHIMEQRQEIHILCEGGQVIRPLIVADNLTRLKPGMSFRHMLSLGIIEYVNAAEAQTCCYIATCFEQFLKKNNSLKKITHIEIIQESLISRNLAKIPFVTSMTGARVSYCGQQEKQKMTSEPKLPRGTIQTTQLLNSCRPLVTTQSELDTFSFSGGAATPAIVCLCSPKDAQEDAVVIKKSSLERGFGDVSITRFYSTDEPRATKKYREAVEKRVDLDSRKNLDYSTVQANGLPKKKTWIPGGGIVIAKNRTTIQQNVAKTENNKAKRKQEEKEIETTTTRTTDISLTTHRDESGQVTSVDKIATPSGARYQVGVTSHRSLVVGDKGTTRQSQKGILARIVNEEDMPFSEQTGIAPDMMCQFMGDVSRTTMARLLEIITGKAVALSGKLELGVDKQLFSLGNKRHVKQVQDVLKAYGFASSGQESYRDGRTGELMIGHLFTGVLDYSRVSLFFVSFLRLFLLCLFSFFLWHLCPFASFPIVSFLFFFAFPILYISYCVSPIYVCEFVPKKKFIGSAFGQEKDSCSRYWTSRLIDTTTNRRSTSWWRLAFR
jgi:DNA-directed RNA polymerase beta subunit